MEDIQQFYFLQEIANNNIVALTSRCNCRCLFCSHGNNPKDAVVHYCGDIPLNRVLAGLDFIDPKETVVIGESASPLSEGEPFLYPHIFEVLGVIREKYPKTPISITTNGSFLTKEVVEKILSFQPLTLNLSLNTIGFRRELMGDRGKAAVNAPPLLSEYNIPYNGSVVALPEVTGWKDIEDTIGYLQRNHCQTLRLLLPGYSRLGSKERFYNWQERRQRCSQIAGSMPGINLLEPPQYKHNYPIIYGVMSGSVGEISGFRKGDLILSVNSKKPKNRREAWELLSQSALAQVNVDREGNTLSLSLNAPKGQCGGLVFENDLDNRRLKAAEDIYISQGGKAGICCSGLGRDYIEANLPLFPGLGDVDLITVENKYFGGNIAAAGLLTIGDFNQALKSRGDLDYVFLPSECLNSRGGDLRGEGPEDLIVKGYFI